MEMVPMDIDDDGKYQDGGDDEDEEGEMVFAGQIARASTQVTGLTNLEKSKTLMTIQTSAVQTKTSLNRNNNNNKKNAHSKPSAYVPSPDLFKFSNPDRPDDDLQTAQNQVYNDKPLTDPNVKLKRDPTFTKPTNLRPYGGNPKNYPKSLLFRSDGSAEIVFGKLSSKLNCCGLILSTLLSWTFIVVAILFFPLISTDNDNCDNSSCSYTEVPNNEYLAIINSEVTLLDGCDRNIVLLSFDNYTTSSSSLDILTWSEVELISSDDSISSMYIAGTNDISGWISNCASNIESSSSITLQIGIELDADEHLWDWSASGFFLIISIIMALFFILNEWLFYSYLEIMIPYKDYRAAFIWYIIRMGWMSYMFTIIISHSFVVIGDISFMIGTNITSWTEAQCYIATCFIAISLLICLCCCCFQESDGIVGTRMFASGDDLGCEKYFLPQSRVDALVINEFEQALGSAMCGVMLFISGFIICGFIPFFIFMSAGLNGYTNTPYISSLWFLSIIGMTIQMLWFVRARCCGDEEDKRKAAVHDNKIQQRGGAPQVNRSITSPL